MALRRRLVQPSATPFRPRIVSRPPLPLTQLSAAFRQRGLEMAEISPEAARTFEFCAAWLDASREAELDKALTLMEAAKESGWSYEGLRQKLARVASLNAAASGPPMIRRRDLPLLGAARGPRGTYSKPRKGKEQAASSPSAIPDEVTPATPHATRAVPSVADAASTSGTACVQAEDEKHEEHKEHADSASNTALPGHSHELAAAAQDSASPATDAAPHVTAATTRDDPPRGEVRPRKTLVRHRRGSTRDRFHELCVRATLS